MNLQSWVKLSDPVCYESLMFPRQRKCATQALFYGPCTCTIRYRNTWLCQTRADQLASTDPLRFALVGMVICITALQDVLPGRLRIRPTNVCTLRRLLCFYQIARRSRSTHSRCPLLPHILFPSMCVRAHQSGEAKAIQRRLDVTATCERRLQIDLQHAWS